MCTGCAFGSHTGANCVTSDHAANVADFLVVEDDNRQFLFHAVVKCLSIHDLQILGENITVTDVRVENGVRVFNRILGKDTIDLCRLQDHVSINFPST